jgi:acetoacetyl-CoA synthetase
VSESELIWSPPEKLNSLLQQFFNKTQSLHSGKSFADIQTWSVQDSRKFWSEVWDFCGVIGTKGSQENKESILPKAEYFENSQINLLEENLQCFFLGKIQIRSFFAWTILLLRP